MLVGSNMAFMAGAAPIPFTGGYVSDAYSGSTGLTTYTYTSQAIGTAASNRIVIVGVTNYSASSSRPSSVTIGGISATGIGTGISDGNCHASIWYAAVPTGTTATIAVNYGAANGYNNIFVWSIYGNATTVGYTATGGVSNATVSGVNANTGAFTCACVASNGTVPITWSGSLTQDAQLSGGAGSAHGCSSTLGALSGATVTAICGNQDQFPLAVASFNPA